MAALDVEAAPSHRHEQVPERTINDAVYAKVHDLIVERTGHQPNGYFHLYNFKCYIDKFLHPNPGPCRANRRPKAIPLGLGQDRIPQQLLGWDDLSEEEVHENMLIFNRFTTDDLQEAFDLFYCQQARVPRVEEFARYVLTLEGNDSPDTSRKTLGNLFIENAEQKMNLRQNQQTLELLREMMSSKDIMNDSLSRTVVSHLAEIEDLRTSRQHLQQILRIVQVERTQLQEEKNVLKMDLDIVEGQNETLRAEKIRLDLNCNKLKTRNRELEEKAEVEAKLLDEIVENINRNLAIVEGRLCEAENNLRKMVRENGQLKQILTTVTEDKCRLEQDNSRLEQDNSRLIDVYNRLEQTLTNVNEDKCRLEEGYNRLEQDNSRLAQTLTTVTEDKFRLEQDNSRLEQTLITVTDDKCRLEQTLTTVTEDKCRLEQTLTTVTEDKCRLEQTLTSVTKDNNRLEQVNSRLEDGYSRLEQTLTTVTDDKCRLEQDKSRLEQTLTTVTEDNNRLEQDNSRLEQDNSRLEQDNSRLEQGYIKLEQNNSKLELNQKSLQRQLFALKGLFIILILGFMLAVFNGSSHNLSGSLS